MQPKQLHHRGGSAVHYSLNSPTWAIRVSDLTPTDPIAGTTQHTTRRPSFNPTERESHDNSFIGPIRPAGRIEKNVSKKSLFSTGCDLRHCRERFGLQCFDLMHAQSHTCFLVVLVARARYTAGVKEVGRRQTLKPTVWLVGGFVVSASCALCHFGSRMHLLCFCGCILFHWFTQLYSGITVLMLLMFVVSHLLQELVKHHCS